LFASRLHPHLSHHCGSREGTMDLYVTGYGSKLVPRVPFCLSFRPPKLAIESGDNVVFFGPAGDGLGFSPKGAATVEDVTLDITEYPRLPTYSVHTQHFGFPVTDHVNVYSATETSGHSFEVQLADAAHRDEMLWVQGPFAGPLDLTHATGSLVTVAEGTVEKSNGAVRWRECQYPLDGSTWHKRFYALTLFSTRRLGIEHHFALLAQCPAPRTAAVFEWADRWGAALSSEDWQHGG
jgi:hypothetical protein